MLDNKLFNSFFQKDALQFLLQSIDIALAEDGQDLTTMALFSPEEHLRAWIIAKEKSLIAGLPLIKIIFSRIKEGQNVQVHNLVPEGSEVEPRQQITIMEGSAPCLLKAERIILNFLTHLSGIANLTNKFVQKLQGTKTKLLDTRKTLPGLRYPEKYAVRIGGGINHRLNLEQMLMLKDNHIDRAGGISIAVKKLRYTYSPCPPIEVECRTLGEVKGAVQCNADRIMLDNMTPSDISTALEHIPSKIETEISGKVTLANIDQFAQLGANYISVGCLTHSATISDLSMTISKED